MAQAMTIHLKVWRQSGPDAKGELVGYTLENLNEDMSFLEALDVLNEELIKKGEDPVCLLYTSPSPRDRTRSRMPSSA